MRKKRRDRGSNRRGMVCISAVVLVLLVTLFVQSNTIKQKNAIYTAQEAQLQTQLEAEEQRSKDIEDMKAYMQTKEYAEKVARDKLGLVYKDEILFKENE